MELQLIQSKIYDLRGLRVMLDFDLALLYDVKNFRLKEQVKRNIERFPSDFMFQLTKAEWLELIANCDNLPENAKFSPATPYAFTQEGVAMLSGILRSPLAIQVNINIMRAFVVIRNYALVATTTEKELIAIKKQIKALTEDMESLGKDHEEYDKQFDDIYIALSELASRHEQINKPRNPIGFDKQPLIPEKE
ncbi:MAG TPA: ORF6N domain-containing protein [Paludibacter sp.]|nr:ORF6N domain-containing protein [Paludibacter sp.]